MDAHAGHPLAPGSGTDAPDDSREASPTILRFHRSERWLHWALAIPYVLLYASALMMLAAWSEPQPRHLRSAFGLIHRIAGVALIVLPPVALLWGRREWRAHLENLREGWVWTRDDFRWLRVAHRAALDPGFPAPEQGKFNAAEKLNFMMVSATYALYVATGVAVWLPGTAFLPWVLHCAMAVLGLPLVAGHIFMATVNPSTRIGITGMITGRVDRKWARHHYRRWYRENFEPRTVSANPHVPVDALEHRALVRCGTCREVHVFPTWSELLERMFRLEPLSCPRCEAELALAATTPDQATAAAILSHLERGLVDEPFEAPSSRAG
jgi:formate dehydrogenase subunit gamma